MLKKLVKAIGAIVKQLAIAFFFSSIIIGVMSLFVKDKIELGFSLVNNFAASGEIGEKVEAKYDVFQKRIIKYPKYGTIFATLKIPSLNIEKEVVHGDDMEILRKNVGHFSGSYFPGEGSSIIFCAHNTRQFFMFLPTIEIGAEIIVETDYGNFKYRVFETKIIKDTDESALPIQKDKEMLMIYTCYPTSTIGHKDHRFVLYADLETVEYVGGNHEA